MHTLILSISYAFLPQILPLHLVHFTIKRKQQFCCEVSKSEVNYNLIIII